MLQRLLLLLLTCLFAIATVVTVVPLPQANATLYDRAGANIFIPPI